MRQKGQQITLMVKIFVFLLLPLITLAKPVNVQARYNGTPVKPQQVTMQNFQELGLTREEALKSVGYYLIRNAEELYGYFYYCAQGNREYTKARLMNDIVVNDYVLDDNGELADSEVMIEWPSEFEYYGEFDGNNHVISGLCQTTDLTANLNYYSTGQNINQKNSASGFILYARGATIKNLTITDSYFECLGAEGEPAVGGIVGYAMASTIENCTNEATVVGSKYAAGIIGNSYTPDEIRVNKIVNCVNKGKIVGIWSSGIGTASSIEKCVNEGYVYGSGQACGIGNVGVNCLNTGTIEAGTVACGIARFNSNNRIIIWVKNCVNIGQVKGPEAYALYGSDGENDSSNSYYLEGIGDKSKNPGYSSKTLEEFKSGEVCLLLNGKESNENVAWRQTIDEDNYPTLNAESKIVYERGYKHGSDERGVSNEPPANGTYHEAPNRIRKHNNYLEHFPAKEATCTEKGNVEYYHCTVCDKYYSDSEAKTEITDISGLTSDALGHDYATTWSIDKSNHWHACKRCGDKKDVAAHVSSGAATESKAETCTVCGYEISPILEHQHAMQLISAKSATCSEPGNIAYYVCAKCKKYFQDSDGKVEITDLNSVVIPKIAHKYSDSWSNDDKNHWHSCEVCGEKKDVAVHAYTDDFDTSCNVCGYVRTIQPKTKVQDEFSDISVSDWFLNAVQFVYDRKIMNGVSKTSFAPKMVLTREQFITVLYNMEGGPEIEFKQIFDDVKNEKNVWYAKSVTWAAENNITSGIGNNLFGTGKEITREQLATLLYNYAQQKDEYKLTIDANAISKFPDANQISSWASDGMTWAVTNGVMGGKSGKGGQNFLDPQGKASRAECAQMIMNLKQKAVK